MAISPRSGDVASDADRARLREYAVGAGVAVLAAWCVRVFLARQNSTVLFDQGTMAHLCAALALLSGAPLARFFGTTQSRLVGIDAAITIGSNVAWCWMGSNANRGGIDLMVVLAMSFGIWLRTVLIPSSAPRTLLLCAASGAALLLLLPTPLRIPMFGGPTRGIPPLAAMRSILWWAGASYLAVCTSRLVHGLRLQVSRALRVGQYTLEEKIGEGAMGVVYRARHALLRRATAVKVLPASRAGARAVARFEREVRLMATLTHPNTVTVFDYGRTPEGTFYYAMELLDGASLQGIVAETGPFPAARIVHVMRQIASALAEAHDAGLVHRDVKPANVVLCRAGGVDDVAKVLDFGIVRDRGEAHPGHEGIVGTPPYMAPEAIAAPATVGPASDLYSLGAVGVFLATGAPPFGGGTVVEVLARQLEGAAASPLARSPDPLPRALEEVIERCLSNEPAGRPASARALVEALDACDIGRWTEGEARDFWRTKGAALRSTLARENINAHVATVGSIGVDLSARE